MLITSVNYPYHPTSQVCTCPLSHTHRSDGTTEQTTAPEALISGKTEPGGTDITEHVRGARSFSQLSLGADPPSPAHRRRSQAKEGRRQEPHGKDQRRVCLGKNPGPSPPPHTLSPAKTSSIQTEHSEEEIHSPCSPGRSEGASVCPGILPALGEAPTRSQLAPAAPGGRLTPADSANPLPSQARAPLCRGSSPQLPLCPPASRPV